MTINNNLNKNTKHSNNVGQNNIQQIMVIVNQIGLISGIVNTPKMIIITENSIDNGSRFKNNNSDDALSKNIRNNNLRKKFI